MDRRLAKLGISAIFVVLAILSGDVLRELLAVYGLGFALGVSRAGGDYGLGFRTWMRACRLGALIECPFCLGFWCALSVRFAFLAPVYAVWVALVGAILVLGATVLVMLAIGRSGTWRHLVGAMLAGALFAPALVHGGAALVMIDRVAPEFLLALGDAAFCYVVHRAFD